MQTITRKSYTGQTLVYTVIGEKIIGRTKYLVCRMDGAEVLLPA
jgi:hypothetical protein